MFYRTKAKKDKAGFTMVEVLIGAAILLIVVTGIFAAFVSIIKTVRAARVKTDAMLLANEQVEIARNLPYTSVGIVGGFPAGKIPYQQTVVRDGFQFLLTASVRNIDDPFDGLLGGSPSDLSPADYKQFHLDIECLNCQENTFASTSIVTTIAPINLESSAGTGNLKVSVFNANGDPVSGASVRIVNASSSINVNDKTNNAGEFVLVGAPTGNLVYEITVTKTGYSTDQTIRSSVQNPNPSNPPKSVAAGQVTEASFSIDSLAQLKIYPVSAQCTTISNVPVRVQGAKKIGQSPDIYKFDQTNSGSLITLNNLEWDTYKFIIPTSSTKYLAGSLPLSPLFVPPGSSLSTSLILVPKIPKGLLISVVDASNGLPLDDVTVSIGASSLETARGSFFQTDWSGGSGQTEFSNLSKFFDTDGNIDFATPGELRLRSSLGSYVSSGVLTSSVFDTGATSTDYFQIRWSPADQATSTGAGSVRMQIASGDDPATTTWQFKGPDGTGSSYYEISNSGIGTMHNGNRYVRYKMFLQTADTNFTPNVSDISLTSTSLCVPPGQVYFEGLSGLSQTVSANKTGYQSYSSIINTSDEWQSSLILMQPD